ncbi:MAG: hypothetical protein WCO56_04350 [Verrucomicrobiota bacterium]
MIIGFPLQSRSATTNDFSTSTNGWLTDRFASHTFTYAPVFQVRTHVLQIGMDPAESSTNRPAPYQADFFDVQGFAIQALISSNTHWAVYGSLWVPAEVADGSAAPFGSDLWARTGPLLDQTSADYFMIGLFAGDTNNPTNPNPVNPTVSWRVWSDDIVGAWTYLPVPVNVGWNDVRISFNNFVVAYYLNSQLVHTQTSANMAHPDHTTQLSTVFLQAYNFGNVYTASWSNVGDTDASVEVLPLPLWLHIVLGGQPEKTVVLSWSTNSAGFVLEQNGDLVISNAWANVLEDRVTNNGQIYVTVPVTLSSSFYRLRKP